LDKIVSKLQWHKGKEYSLIRLTIRGSNNNDSMIEELREQSLQNHGIGNVRHLKLVEANQPGFVLDDFSDWRNRIECRWLCAGIVSRLCLLDSVDLLVDVRHESVEVHATFLCCLAAIIEEIHEHCLAAANRAVDVESFGCIDGLLLAKLEPFEGAGRFWRLVRLEMLVDLLELLKLRRS